MRSQLTALLVATQERIFVVASSAFISFAYLGIYLAIRWRFIVRPNLNFICSMIICILADYQIAQIYEAKRLMVVIEPTERLSADLVTTSDG